MKHDSSRALFDYWNELRGARVAPRRTAVEPAAISSILRDTFILQATDPGYPFRLAGTRLCAMFGRELKRSRFTNLWHPDGADRLDLILLTVAEEGRPFLIGATAQAERGRQVAVEVLLLPLVQSGPNYDRIMGVAAPVEVPYWLGVEPVTTLRPVSDRLLATEDSSFSERQAPQPSFVQSPPSIAEAAARRDRFIVLDGGKSG